MIDEENEYRLDIETNMNLKMGRYRSSRKELIGVSYGVE
jgi:hypothetical protein